MKALFRHRLAPRQTDLPLAHLPLAHRPLARKLALVTALKLLVLMALWWAFFSGNGQGGEGMEGRDRDMTPDQAAAAILRSGITVPTESSTQ